MGLSARQQPATSLSIRGWSSSARVPRATKTTHTSGMGCRRSCSSRCPPTVLFSASLSSRMSESIRCSCAQLIPAGYYTLWTWGPNRMPRRCRPMLSTTTHGRSRSLVKHRQKMGPAISARLQRTVATCVVHREQRRWFSLQLRPKVGVNLARPDGTLGPACTITHGAGASTIVLLCSLALSPLPTCAATPGDLP